MSEKEYGKWFVSSLKGGVLGVPVCFVCLLAASFALTGICAGDTVFVAVSWLCRAVGAFTAGLLAALLHREQGLVCGAGAGIVFALLVCVIGLIGYGSSFSWALAMIGFAVSVVIAAAGGVLGVNIRR